MVPSKVTSAVCGGAPAGASAVKDNSTWDAAFYFAAPSGNLRCVWSRTGLGCSLLVYDFDGPSKPSDCDLGWDPSVVWLMAEVEAGTCTSERLDAWYQDGIPKLAYGKSYARGRWACLSAKDGMTCWNTVTHHGFKLSREAELTW